jgi:hypothetical protein
MVIKKPKKTIKSMTRHCTTQCAGSCRGREVFTGREYMLLFRDGRPSTEHEDYTEK